LRFSKRTSRIKALHSRGYRSRQALLTLANIDGKWVNIHGGFRHYLILEFEPARWLIVTLNCPANTQFWPMMPIFYFMDVAD
jgi:hypothetical protein